MAVTVTDLRTIIDEADANTAWTSTATLTANNTSPTPVEADNRLDIGVSNATQDCFVTVLSTDLTNELIYFWFSHRAEFDTLANVGVGIQIGDGTNRVAYGIIGSDAVAFAHFEGPVVWQCLVLDVANRAAYPSVTIAGAAGSLNVAAITQIGLRMKTVVKAVGGAVNCFIDIGRRFNKTANNGCALSITGGTSGAGAGTFEDIAAADRSIGDLQAHGIVRKLGSGVYGVQGPLRFGEATGTNSSWFEVSNISVVFEDRKLSTDVYRIVIVDNGTGTTTFILTDCALIVPTGVGASFDSLTDTDVTAVTVTGTRIDGFTGGVSVGGGAGQIFTNCTFSNGGAVSVTSQPVDLTDSSVLLSTVAADASALVWNVNTNPDGLLDNMTFSKGTNAHHAIEFGASSPTTMTLRGVTFTGFDGANEQPGSTLLFADRGTDTTWTVNIVGGTTPSFKKARVGDTIDIVANPVSVTITVQDVDGNKINDARVYLPVSAGGPFPHEASVTITRSGATATVTHTGHGLVTNDKVKISGANEVEYNGVFTITKIDDNSYSYTVSGTPATPATGTITSTFVVLKGLTAGTPPNDGKITMSRVFPSDQLVSGWVRKSTSSPFYKTGIISGTVSSSGGFSATAIMILDE